MRESGRGEPAVMNASSHYVRPPPPPPPPPTTTTTATPTLIFASNGRRLLSPSLQLVHGQGPELNSIENRTSIQPKNEPDDAIQRLVDALSTSSWSSSEEDFP